MMLRGLYVLALLCAMVIAGCRQNADYTPVPLPYGYQRAELYDSVYTQSDSLPDGFAVNVGARVCILSRGGGDAVKADVRYDAYDATLHLTFTPADASKMDGVVANRQERMALNLGDNYAVVSELAANDHTPFTTTIMQTSARIPTPVQILSVGPGLVISGALNFDAESVDMDSVMPMVKAVVRDLEYAAARLR